MGEEDKSFIPQRTLRIGLLVLLLAVPVAGGLISFFGFVQNGVSGVDGIGGVADISLSPDGAYLFAVGSDDHSLAVFVPSSSATTDGLVFLDRYEDDTNGVFGLLGASGVAASPDGRHLYVTAEIDDTLAVFRRDATMDDLTFVAAELQENGVDGVIGIDGASSVAVSPDDSFVVVTARVDDSLAVFGRDATTDDLQLEDVEIFGPAPLQGASDVAFSPDSRHIYATAEVDDTLVVFERTSSSPTQIEYVSHFQDGIDGVDGLDGASSVAVSPDGRHVYVAGKLDDALSLYERDSTTGTLSLTALYQHGVDGIDGLRGPSAVNVHPSGFWVLVAGRFGDTMALFERDQITGVLTLQNVFTDGVDGIDGLAGAAALASKMGRAYVAGQNDDAIASFDLDTSAFTIFTDGFESGDTSAWSSTSP